MCIRDRWSASAGSCPPRSPRPAASWRRCAPATPAGWSTTSRGRSTEADVMLRGLVDIADAQDWLATQGFGWLRLRDNGVLPPGRPTGLDAAAVPTHVYHLMPAGLSKGLAVRHDLARHP